MILIKNIKFYFIKLLIVSIVCSCIFSQAANRGAFHSNSAGLITGEDYITGDDGIPRITLNIWGHVKYPGTYLVYDGIDILTALSMAGGLEKGAKTKSITIISRNGDSKVIDLDSRIIGKNLHDVKLKPHDTIHIDETFGSYILSKGSFLIQLTNLVLIATRN